MSTTRSPRFVAKFLVGGAIAVVATVLACGGGGDQVGPGKPPKPAAGVTIVAGGGVTDTIGAPLTQALTVEVHDSLGNPVAGTVVRFTGVDMKNSGGYAQTTAFVEALDANGFSNFAGPTTDTQGRTGVYVKLGTLAGPARVALAVPAYGYADTVSFTVQPGAPAKLSFLPADTGVTIGKSVQLHAAMVDRAGNARSEAVTYDASPNSAVATVSSSGNVSGVAVGAVTLTAHAGTLSATGSVEVVPTGVIALYYGGGYYPDSTGIVTMNLDGSNRRWITRVGGSSNAVTSPVWTSAGDLIYPGPESATNYNSRLFIVTPGSAPKLLNPTPAPGGSTEGFPQFDRATGKTYYSGFSSGSSWNVFARASDGTITAVSPEGPTTLAWRPSPSPDGTKLAYVTSVNYSGAFKVFDLNAGTTSSWNVAGQYPTWSPKGDQIAYVPSYSGKIGLVNADGSNQHWLTSVSYQEYPFTWSPDGAWILAKSSSGSMDLINASTGASVPLKYLSAYYYPSWK